MPPRTLTTTLLLASTLLAACSTPPGSANRRIDTADYDAVFDAAKDALRDRGFDLARVDARAGIIQTQPRASSGPLTPWVRHTTNLDTASRGVLHHERRTARVTFDAPPAPTDANPTTDPDTTPDTAPDTAPVSYRVEVAIERLYRPARRLDPTSIRLRSNTVGRTAGEPDLTRAAEPKDAGQDPGLAREIADDIERMIDRSS